MTDRAVRTRTRMEELMAGFDGFVLAFDKHSPFDKPQQLGLHQQTILRRRNLGSAVAALQDDSLLSSLYQTLLAWGLGTRGSKLEPFPVFVERLRSHVSEIAALEQLKLSDPLLPTQKVWPALWQIVNGLGITPNKAKLVAGCKALHHLLPDLVAPVDREYTGTFFGWYDNEFEYERQRPLLRDGLTAFAEIARRVDPERLVGAGWHTSATKLIDNAIVGYCLSKRLRRHEPGCG